MKKIFQITLPFLLCLVICIGVLPVSAAAVNDARVFQAEDGTWRVQRADNHPLGGGIVKDGWAEVDLQNGDSSWQMWYYADENGVLLTGWQEIEGKWYYFNEDLENGRSPMLFMDQVTKIDGTWYALDKTGARVDSGWFALEQPQRDSTVKTFWFYAVEDGALAVGWKEIDGNWYWFNDDEQNGGPWMSTQVTKIDGDWYAFDNQTGIMISSSWTKQVSYGNEFWFYAFPDGKLATGWQVIDGTQYHFNEKDSDSQLGVPWMSTEYWDRENNVFYFFNDDGTLINTEGWRSHGQYWFWVDADSTVPLGWKEIGGSWYYFYPNAYLDGTYTINGEECTFDANGVLIKGNRKGCWVGNWEDIPQGGVMKYMLADGGWAYGWQKFGDNWCYFDENGVMMIGWQEIDGNWYYFDYGQMIVGTYCIDGTTYEFDENGVWIEEKNTGDSNQTNGSWIDGGGVWWYQFADGSWAYGWQEIDGSWYYFDEGGVMVTGWQELGGIWYYFYDSGAMASDTTVDGYTLSASGAMI